MPEVLLKKFLISVLIGVGCLIGGIVGKAVYDDMQFLLLSIGIFIGMMIRVALILYIAKSENYVKVEGKVIEMSRQLFSAEKRISLDVNEETIEIHIPKDVKIDEGCMYRFYFMDDNSKTAENFIGCEIIHILDKQIRGC